MSANVETMAYRGETPWHGLGEDMGQVVAALGREPTLEEWQARAGLGWGVAAPRVQFTLDGKLHESEGHRVLVRTDTMHVFDTVGSVYEPFQNTEILEFFREYVEAGDMKLETLGALGRGEVVWALATMDKGFELAGGDRVSGYVLISNPHKYGQGCTVKFTSVRVVCSNTLAMALGGGGGLQLPHNKKFDASYRQHAKEKLGIARERMDAFEEDARTLAALNLTDADAEQVLEAVFGEQHRVQESILGLYSGAGLGSELPSAVGTGWGLLNAVTEYFDWHSGRVQDTRLKSAWYGAGASKKQATLRELLADARG